MVQLGKSNTVYYNKQVRAEAVKNCEVTLRHMSGFTVGRVGRDMEV